MSELTRLSWSERRKLARVLRPVGATLGNPSTRPVGAIRAVKLLLKATEQERYEWVYWYILGDLCQELGLFDEALRACCCCYHLRPDDGRSIYALASAFRQLSEARLVGRSEVTETLARLEGASYWAPKPKVSAAALSSLGLTIEEAAAAAVHFFTETLSYVRGKDEELVQTSLAMLQRAFPGLTPELSQKVLAAPLQYVREHRP
jgi:tetratricopeptide (TPR) repeat protein